VQSDISISIYFAAARAFHFAACLTILAALVFDRFIMPRQMRRQIVGDSPAIQLLWKKIAAWMLGLALPIAGLSGIAWFAVVTIDMTDLPLAQALQGDNLRLVLTHTHFGSLWQLRSAIWLATALFVIAAATKHPAHTALKWSATFSAALLVGSLAWSGHGQNGQPAQWHLLADVLHLLICAIWPIGLLPMTFLLLNLRRSNLPDRSLIASRIVNRFSAASLVAVGLLAATGIVNSCYLLDSVRDLLTTLYGRVLLTKILLFMLLVGIGAWNLLRLKPRLASSPRNALKLQWMMAAELTLATAVILIVSLLGTLPLPQG
jgi:putative copper resistance protein D